MNNVFPFPAKPVAQRFDGPFEGCPYCHSDEGFHQHVNVERFNYVLCTRHGLYWLLGENLFSSWRDETPETWRKNKLLLDGFKFIEPFTPWDDLPRPPA